MHSKVRGSNHRKGRYNMYIKTGYISIQLSRQRPRGVQVWDHACYCVHGHRLTWALAEPITCTGGIEDCTQAKRIVDQTRACQGAASAMVASGAGVWAPHAFAPAQLAQALSHLVPLPLGWSKTANASKEAGGAVANIGRVTD